MTDKENDPPEAIHGDVPEGLGPEVFREQLRHAAQQDPAHGAHITIDKETVFLEDVETVEEEPAESHKSRVRLRNGAIIGGLTGAAIVAALATVRYRRRKSG